MSGLPAALGGEPRFEVLENGLSVCLLESPGTGLVSTVLCYRAGTLVEPRGQEGIAHFLEHMMFKSSASYGSGEIDRLTLSLGGSNNAFTSHDSTVYHFSFAKDRWEEALSIEADRMRGLELDRADVSTEAGVILEEIALHEADPWSALEQGVRAMSYAGHGYGRDILGRPETVAGIGEAELEAFHLRQYGPDNAVLIVAGDFGEGPFEKVRAAFGGLESRGSEMPQSSIGALARRAGRLERRRGDVARLVVAVPVPEATHPDHVPLRLLAAILGTGRSSRLSRLLVDELQLCLGVSCDVSETVEPGSMSIEAEVISGVSPAEVEERALTELMRLGREPAAREELERVRAIVHADWVFAHERVLEKALTLGLAIAQFDSDYLGRVSADLAVCGIERLFEVGRRYLESPSELVVGWSLPEEG